MKHLSPAQIERFLSEHIHQFDVPEAYYGDEPNTYQWTEAQWQAANLRCVLLASFDYLQGMGNTTIPLIYGLSNEHGYPDRVTERCYAITAHTELRLMERHGIPPWGLETRHALGEYDLIACSLSYLPYWANLVKMLKLAGIPLRWKDRVQMTEPYPLVMVGGHSYASPGSLWPSADIIWCGEAEDETLEAQAQAKRIYDPKALQVAFQKPRNNPGFNAVLDDLAEYRRKGLYFDPAGREQMLHELAVKYEFLLVPRFYEFQHAQGPDGHWRVSGWTKKYDDIPTQVSKRFVRNLDAAYIPTKPVISFNTPGYGGATIAVSKGCSYHSIALDTRIATDAGFIRLGDVPSAQPRQVMTAEGAYEIDPSEFISHEAEVLQIELENGARLRLTAEHRVVFVDQTAGYQLEWKAASDLQAGEYIAFRVGSDVYGPQQVVDGRPFDVGAAHIAAQEAFDRLQIPEAVWRSPQLVIRAFLFGSHEAAKQWGLQCESFVRELQVLAHLAGYRAELRAPTVLKLSNDPLADEIPAVDGQTRSRLWLQQYRPNHPLLRQHEDVLYLKVRSIEPLPGKTPVGDIHVHAQHAFLANGFAVSNCSFCAATYREAPYRERSQQVVVDSFKETLKYGGYSTVSPLSLEFGTYSRKKALLRQLHEEVTGSVLMPALRVDVFAGDPVFGQLSVRGQKSNVTIAVEGNSNKMRHVVSKGITGDDVLKAFENAIAAGYSSAKFYMICNLPGESAADHDEIVELMRQVDAIRKSVGSNIRVMLSWKPLTVESNTPLQWFACRQYSSDFTPQMREIQAMGFGTRMGDEVKSSLGNVIQLAEMADDVAGEILLDTFDEANCTTTSSFSKSVYDVLLRNMEKHGRTFDDYFRPKDLDEVFMWDIVNTQISKDYLKRLYKLTFRRTIDDPTLKIWGNGFIEKFGSCAIGCTRCGACDDDMLDQMQQFALREDEPVQLTDIRSKDLTTVRQRFQAIVSIDPYRRFITKEHWLHAIRRACFLNDIPIAVDSISFLTDRASNTTKRWFGGRDYLDFGLTDSIDPSTMLDRMNAVLAGSGLSFESIAEVRNLARQMRRSTAAFWWEIAVDKSAREMAGSVETALRDGAKFVYKIDHYRAGNVNRTVDVREVVSDAFVTIKGTEARIVLLMDAHYSPYDAVKSLIRSNFEVYRFPAVLQAALSTLDSVQGAADVPVCEVCGVNVPLDVFGNPVHESRCIRHHYGNSLVSVS